MLQLTDGNRIPAHWAERAKLRTAYGVARTVAGNEPVRIALINNMPDPALEDTEGQFFDLLDTAAGSLPVSVKLYSLPGIPRGSSRKAHMADFYWDFADLFKSRFDGVIVTGTEPHQPELQQEPYWSALVDVFRWAEENVSSIVLSCLAAHGAVLQGDGIARRRLADKQFGVFDEWKCSDHALLEKVPEPLRFPHSRWNELDEEALAHSGYAVLTKSAEAGANMFVKMRKKCLFVHFQGHPEYGAGTLGKEFRRDVKRFLRKERETYPTLPHGYFDEVSQNALNEFQERALLETQEDLMETFPEAALNGTGESAWRTAATCVYCNWLQYMIMKRTGRSAYNAVAPRPAWVSWSR
jgi:homoserine O-succinyltransferase